MDIFGIPPVLKNPNLLSLDLEDTESIWDNETKVIEYEKKKFLFDYVADIFKGDSLDKILQKQN